MKPGINISGAVQEKGATKKELKKTASKDNNINNSPTKVQPYNNTQEYIEDEILCLDVILEYCIQRKLKSGIQSENISPIHISKEYIESLLANGLLTERFTQNREESLAILSTKIQKKKKIIQQRIAQSYESGSLERIIRLKSICALSDFEMQILIVAIAPIIDARYEKIYSYIQDDITLVYPTIQLLFAIFANNISDISGIREYIAKTGNLARNKLIQYENNVALNRASTQFFIDPRIADYLLGSDSIDQSLTDFIEVFHANEMTNGKHLPEIILNFIKNFSKLFLKSRENIENQNAKVTHITGIIFKGDAPYEKLQALDSLNSELQTSAIIINTEAMLYNQGQFTENLNRIFRENMLFSVVLYFENFNCLTKYPELLSCFFNSLDQLRPEVPFIFDLEESVHQMTKSNKFAEIEFIRPEYSERKQLWRKHLSDTNLNGSLVDTLSDRYEFNNSQMKKAMQAAQIRMGMQGREDLVEEDIFYGSARQSFHELDKFGVRIGKKYSFEDIVLPLLQIQQLESVISAHKQKRKVYEKWDFKQKVLYGRGLSLMFSGKSGTGKTMAASVIASKIGLDIYKIDLSTVISKYIGETEKNLSKIFKEAQTADAILFFDEADAIFGKRTEVKDAHDRYANIETGYLLQKMEEYDGITILATNFRQNMDDAFKRRIKFIVEFPDPQPAQREQIWVKCFPKKAPLAKEIDFNFLAEKVDMSGGHIKNIAVFSAIMAAQDNCEIKMKHLLYAVRSEYQKESKGFNIKDFEPYSAELQHG